MKELTALLVDGNPWSWYKAYHNVPMLELWRCWRYKKFAEIKQYTMLLRCGVQLNAFIENKQAILNQIDRIEYESNPAIQKIIKENLKQIREYNARVREALKARYGRESS